MNLPRYRAERVLELVQTGLVDGAEDIPEAIRLAGDDSFAWKDDRERLVSFRVYDEAKDKDQPQAWQVRKGPWIDMPAPRGRNAFEAQRTSQHEAVIAFILERLRSQPSVLLKAANHYIANVVRAELDRHRNNQTPETEILVEVIKLLNTIAHINELRAELEAKET